MKIALIGQKGIPATYGGIENYIEEISTRLVQRGHEVIVYCRPYYTNLEGTYNGVILKKIYTLKTKHLDALSHTFLSSFDSLFRDFDVVNYQALGPSSLSFIPRIFGNARVVVTIHSLDWKRSKWNGLAKMVLKLSQYPSIHSPHKVTCVSNRLKDYFEEKFKKEVTTIPTGINSPITRKADKIKKFGLEKDRYILFLGRLVPEKGCHYLIDAFKQLDTDMKLFIAGNASFSDEYVKRLFEISEKAYQGDGARCPTYCRGSIYRTRGSDESDPYGWVASRPPVSSYQNEKIIFGGYVERDVLEELFSNAYLYVLPSEVEGKSQTLIQALSYGRCVLASDIPENLEVTGKWGYSFKNKDARDLKDKLEYLIGNKKLVKQEEKQRKEYACSNFSWDRTVETLEKVYLDCLNGKGK